MRRVPLQKYKTRKLFGHTSYFKVTLELFLGEILDFCRVNDKVNKRLK